MLYEVITDDAAQDQADGDGGAVEQVVGDVVVQRQADEGGGQEGQDHAHPEALHRAVAGDALGLLPQGLEVEPEHRQHAAQLDDDFEGVAALELQQFLGDDQVAGAGNRQEFGDALDDAEDDA